jgi:isoleucyl-tRNA synthetase
VHDVKDRPDDAVSAELPGMELSIRVTPSAHAKCIRCWHHREDVGVVAEHPEICGRCVENVSGKGEVRRYA